MSTFAETNGTRIDLLTGARHNFEDGHTVTLSEVIGMNSINADQNSINGMNFKI